MIIEDNWFNAIFVSPWGLPLMIPLVLLFINRWIALPLMVLWGVYFLYIVRRSDPIYNKRKNQRSKRR